MKPEAKLPILIFYILLFGVLIFLTAYIFQASLAKGTEIYFFDQTTPNMIQRISGIFQRNPLISMGI